MAGTRGLSTRNTSMLGSGRRRAASIVAFHAVERHRGVDDVDIRIGLLEALDHRRDRRILFRRQEVQRPPFSAKAAPGTASAVEASRSMARRLVRLRILVPPLKRFRMSASAPVCTR